jgi:hypothetical protein
MDRIWEANNLPYSFSEMKPMAYDLDSEVEREKSKEWEKAEGCPLKKKYKELMNTKIHKEHEF